VCLKVRILQSRGGMVRMGEPDLSTAFAHKDCSALNMTGSIKHHFMRGGRAVGVHMFMATEASNQGSPGLHSMQHRSSFDLQPMK
jgi:hypothetical protein